MKKLILLTIFTVLSIFSINSSIAQSGMISGPDRIATALQISQEKERNNIILINSHSFADGMSSVNLSKKENASILYNPRDLLDERNIMEIQRIQPKTVFIVGGTQAISMEIEEEIKALGHKVHRFSGKTRYETNKFVLDYVFPDKKMISQMAIASGVSFADLLSLSALAYQDNIPLILSDYEGKILQLFSYKDEVARTIIAGGDAVLSPQIESKVAHPIRLQGKDRYETSSLVHKSFFPKKGKMYVTTGDNFTDALSGVSLIQNGENIRLAQRSVKEIENNKSYSITRLGGKIRDGNGIALYVNPHQDDETLTMGLQLIRDAHEGKEIYLMQMTRGGSSGAFVDVNKTLEKYGYSPINSTEFSEGRDNEVIAVLNQLGVPEDAFLVYHPNDRLRAVFVTEALIEFIDKMHETTIDIRTMAINPPGTNYDFSAASRDHVACHEGVHNYLHSRFAKTNDNIIDARYFLGARTNVDIAGFTNFTASKSEAVIYNKMLDQYTIWNPKKGRYKIGSLSIHPELEKQRIDLNMYIQQ